MEISIPVSEETCRIAQKKIYSKKAERIMKGSRGHLIRLMKQARDDIEKKGRKGFTDEETDAMVDDLEEEYSDQIAPKHPLSKEGATIVQSTYGLKGIFYAY